ncbi:hypothetical protein Tsubulata_006098 [Turnera subulata]|uniref:Magnesium-dependent phosphatase-1 n=1 Tax=Turnera subulata TaxID=218843 RepID=A0A9Q0FVA8_9ROSI|nr:hypothetical protein Tsubulata_006098 [Turnera subulata]
MSVGNCLWRDARGASRSLFTVVVGVVSVRSEVGLSGCWRTEALVGGSDAVRSQITFRIYGVRLGLLWYFWRGCDGIPANLAAAPNCHCSTSFPHSLNRFSSVFLGRPSCRPDYLTIERHRHHPPTTVDEGARGGLSQAHFGSVEQPSPSCRPLLHPTGFDVSMLIGRCGLFCGGVFRDSGRGGWLCNRVGCTCSRAGRLGSGLVLLIQVHEWIQVTRLVVFDLDYTLWPFYCECRSKREMPSLYPQAKGILNAFKEKGFDMAIASRSPTPDIANTFLDKMNFKPMFVAKAWSFSSLAFGMSVPQGMISIIPGSGFGLRLSEFTGSRFVHNRSVISTKGCEGQILDFPWFHLSARIKDAFSWLWISRVLLGSTGLGGYCFGTGLSHVLRFWLVWVGYVHGI